jgi:hypothetical protein
MPFSVFDCNVVYYFYRVRQVGGCSQNCDLDMRLRAHGNRHLTL